MAINLFESEKNTKTPSTAVTESHHGFFEPRPSLNTPKECVTHNKKIELSEIIQLRHEVKEKIAQHEITNNPSLIQPR